MPAVRGEYRKYFTDHPLYCNDPRIQKPSTRPPIVNANARGDKIKLWCTPCLKAEISNIIEAESRGPAEHRRSYEEIELSLFAPSYSEPHGWTESRSETCIRHLRSCERQPPFVRAQARAIHLPGESPLPPEPDLTVHDTPRANRTQPTIHSPQPLRVNTVGLSNTGIRLDSPSPSPQSWFHALPATGSLPTHQFGFSNPSVPSRLEASSPSVSVYSSSSLPSQTSSPVYPSFSGGKQRKTSQTLKRSRSSLNFESPSRPPWTEDDQRRFESSIGRLTASAGFPLSWVTNPEFIAFCRDFVPYAVIPSRKVLTRRIIPSLVRELRAHNRILAKGHRGTVQADGWTGENNHHLVAFMLTANKRLFTVRVNNTTVERKTAENLLKQMLEVINLLEKEWGVKVIAFTTDASGESLKARKLLRKARPDLVTPDCYCHQINLIVGDYFKADTYYIEHASHANELITWLRSKTAVLGLIRQALTQHGQNELSVIRPVPTRWTAFFLAYRRLLQLRKMLELIVAQDEAKDAKDRIIVQGKKKAKDKAKDMIKLIKDPNFWHGLVRIKHHLSPLAVAANVTQSAYCRLDQVLLTFGTLYKSFKTTRDKYPEDNETCNAVLASIERRWRKSDQEVFIAAVLLNPFIKTRPFRSDPTLASVSAVHSLCARLWRRFFKADPPSDLNSEVRLYMQGSRVTGNNIFNQLRDTVKSLNAEAHKDKKSPDPVAAYEDLFIDEDDPEKGLPSLVKLALRILSICPNSASCERLFSQFGLILTKLRTRLLDKNLVDLTELKLHIRDEHLSKQTHKTLRQRRFGVEAEGHTLSHSESAPPIQPADRSQDVEMSDLTSNTMTSSHRDDSDGSDDTEPGAAASAATNATFTSMTSRLVSLVDVDASDSEQDDTDFNFDQSDEGLEDPDADEESSGMDTFTIEKLFDFNNDHWKNDTHQLSAIGSLEDEMEFYELLNLDAIGELEADLDDCVASIFQTD